MPRLQSLLRSASALLCVLLSRAANLRAGWTDAIGLAGSSRPPLHRAGCRVRACGYPGRVGGRLGGGLRLAWASRSSSTASTAPLRAWRDVTERLPRFSGERLDLVVDYVTYVFVPGAGPAAGGLSAGMVRRGAGEPHPAVVAVSFLRHREQDRRSLLRRLSGRSGISSPSTFSPSTCRHGWRSAVVLICVVFTFVPMRWAHPMRTPMLWPATLGLSAVWSLAAVVTLWSGFPAGWVAQLALAVVAAYGIGLALARSLRG